MLNPVQWIGQALDTVGKFFIKKDDNKLNRKKVVAALLAGAYFGCLVHATDSEDFTACMGTTTEAIFNIGGRL